MSGWRQRLNEYSSMSVLSLVAFRVSLGLTCALAVGLHYYQSKYFLGEPGLFPPELLTNFTPLAHSGDGLFTQFFFAATFLLALAFALGLPGVRWLLPFGLAAIQHRLPLLESGGTAVMQLALVCCLFLPIHQAGSLHLWFKKRRAQSPGNVPGPGLSLNLRLANIGFALLTLQLAVNYFYNAINKLTPEWESGLAVGRAVSNISLATPGGAWFARLPDFVHVAATYASLATEFLLPVLLLMPLRRGLCLKGAAVLMLGLHGFIVLTLQVGIFSWAMLCHVPLLWLASRGQTMHLPQRGLPRVVRGIGAGVYLYLMANSLDLLWHRRAWFPAPKPVLQLANWLRIRQGWGMFARPLDRSFITLVQAQTQEGLIFDPWRERVARSKHEIDELPDSAFADAAYFDVDARVLSQEALLENFSEWLLSLHPLDDPSDHVESFVAWTAQVPAESEWRVPAEQLEERAGAYSLALKGALDFSVSGFQVWQPARVADGLVAPEGTPVLTPIGASFGPECSFITLTFNGPVSVSTLFVQADAYDSYFVEGSLDGESFFALGQIPKSARRQYRSRIVQLKDSKVTQMRIRHRSPRLRLGFISEIAVFDHPVEMPALKETKNTHFIASLKRPAVMGLSARPKRSLGGCAWQAKDQD